MTDAALALQKAIYSTLTGDVAVAALVDGRIYDAPPREPVFPYVMFGATDTRDWSTGSEAGAEHFVTLSVWSRYAGKSEALAAMAAIAAALHDGALVLDGHALVNLRVTETEARRESDGVTWRGMMRLRAVTEPA